MSETPDVQLVQFALLPKALMYTNPPREIERRSGSLPPLSTMCCIALPANPLTIAYAGWYSSLAEGNTSYGIWMEPASTWAEAYGEDTMATLMQSLSERGYPTAVWTLAQEAEHGTSAYFLEKRE